MKKLLIFSLILPILGCQSSTVLLKQEIPANLKQECAELQELKDTMGKAVLLWSVDTVAKYNECKARHAALVKAIN
ncbi:hypothetical protein [Acinetobacter soli]|uniref:hypothetical protein n=1 Tax=Acinetobacter soli TaxID=487316 RepID=UPI0027E40EB4|nr:hypothetical protein [Acinetobacter soli]